MTTPLTERLAAARLPSPPHRLAVRKAAGATLRDLAAELDVTPMTILRWERGDATPTRKHATAYRDLLDQLAGLQ